MQDSVYFPFLYKEMKSNMLSEWNMYILLLPVSSFHQVTLELMKETTEIFFKLTRVAN